MHGSRSGSSCRSFAPSRHRSVTRAVVVVVLVSIILTSVASASRPADAADSVFRRPTPAPVLDPFRLPDGKYGPGNRGIEYDTGDLDRVSAAERGTVVFAGPVAGSLFVTVDHGDGLESSYGFVGHILVREAEEVAGGDLVALTDGPFHFSVRLNGEYLDPEPFFGTRRIVLRLVPHSVQGRKISLQHRLHERVARPPSGLQGRGEGGFR